MAQTNYEVKSTPEKKLKQGEYKSCYGTGAYLELVVFDKGTMHIVHCKTRQGDQFIILDNESDTVVIEIISGDQDRIMTAVRKEDDHF